MGRQPEGVEPRLDLVALRLTRAEVMELDAKAERSGYTNRSAYLRALVREDGAGGSDE